MSGGEFGLALFLYFMAGFVTCAAHSMESNKAGEAASAGLLWPLYALKRLWRMK